MKMNQRETQNNEADKTHLQEAKHAKHAAENAEQQSTPFWTPPDSSSRTPYPPGADDGDENDQKEEEEEKPESEP